MHTDSLDIICFSSSHWDSPLWTNRQHIMNILSERHRVLFVESGLFSKAYTLDILRHRPSRLLPNQWERHEKENLWVYAPGLLPLHRFSHHLQTLAWRIASGQIHSFCRRHNMDNPVLWFYTPDVQNAIGHLNERLVLYDCVDNYAATPYYARSNSRLKRFQRYEENLLRSADIVTTTSYSLYESKRPYNPSTYFVPNVGDAEHFGKALKPDTQIPDDISHITHPIIGFIGAVNSHKIDFDLVREVAQRTPSCQYVFIGPTSGWGEYSSTSKLDLPNVHLLGTRDYAVLPNYAKAFDVCIIPYAINEYTKDVFPLKFYEFMATGKPVVTTALPSLAPYEDFISIVHTPGQFALKVLDALLETDEHARGNRILLAQQNTWQHRASTIEQYIYAALGDSKVDV